MANQNIGIRIPPRWAAHDEVRKTFQQIVQRLGSSSTPTYASLTLSDMTSGSVLFTGTGGLISQDNANFAWNDSTNILTTSASTITNAAVIGSDSVVFQPNADSTTFFQVLDADGGTAVLRIDTINERVEILSGYITTPGSGGESEQFGATASANGLRATAIGSQATADGSFSTAIGRRASTSTFTTAVAIGNEATVTGNGGTAIGFDASAASNGVGIGKSISAVGNVVIGVATSNSGIRGIRIGESGGETTSDYAIVLGYAMVSTTDGDFIAGNTVGGTLNVYFGKGQTNATPVAYTIHGTSGSGTDVAGGGVNIAAGRGTGSGVGGAVKLQTAIAGGSGSSLNTLVDRVVVTQAGFIGFGGEVAPETLFELTHATPYTTLHNSTHEDTDGGRESKLLFKGEQSGGEETTLAEIRISHDGTTDDEKGRVEVYTNRGSDGNSPTLALAVDSDGVLTTKSGRIINLTESTGSTTTIVVGDHYISIQYTDTGTHIATLPAISASNHGEVYHLKDADYNAGGNNITVNTTGSDTIEEETSGLMTADGEAWSVMANNTTKNWEVY